jgi:hypothetical protein
LGRPGEGASVHGHAADDADDADDAARRAVASTLTIDFQPIVAPRIRS